TALRKCCDSIPTSIAYNIINIMGHEWGDYLEYIMNNIKNKEFKSRKEFGEYFKKLSLNFPFRKDNRKIILHYTFQLFSDSDWCGFLSYMELITTIKVEKWLSR
ncbi:MAG: hypothetical protein PHP92_03185, partial [Candidatus Nanoarchaeia archaeon]|nr:hypothetical protein [Candidatus Nanoarchaeia archaeon]